MKLSDWAEKQGIAYLTAYRWFKAGKLPVKAYQSESGTIIVQDEFEVLPQPLVSENTMNNDAMSLFLRKTVEFSKNNAPIEDFAAYILSTFTLQVNYGPQNPKYSKNKPKSEDIQNHFKKFISKVEKPKVNIFVPNQESMDDLVAQSDFLTKAELVSEINSIRSEDSFSEEINDSSEIPEIKDLYKHLSTVIDINTPRVSSIPVTSYNDLDAAGVIVRSNLTPQHHTETTLASSVQSCASLLDKTSYSINDFSAATAASSTISFDGKGSTGSFMPTEKELISMRSLTSTPKKRGRKAKGSK